MRAFTRDRMLRVCAVLLALSVLAYFVGDWVYVAIDAGDCGRGCSLGQQVAADVPLAAALAFPLTLIVVMIRVTVLMYRSTFAPRRPPEEEH